MSNLLLRRSESSGGIRWPWLLCAGARSWCPGKGCALGRARVAGRECIKKAMTC